MVKACGSFPALDDFPPLPRFEPYGHEAEFPDDAKRIAEDEKRQSPLMSDI